MEHSYVVLVLCF